jgi:hypothetical protein
MSMIAIRSLDENRYELPRSELERALARLDELAAQARMLPAYRTGNRKDSRSSPSGPTHSFPSSGSSMATSSGESTASR